MTLEVDLSNVIMTHGTGFIQEKSRCALCGKKFGLKLKCSGEGCRARGERSRPAAFHLSCARQAGLEVNNRALSENEVEFFVHCHKHLSCEFAFRARMEDLIEMEKRRAGKRLEYDSRLMSVSLSLIHI